MKTLCVIFLAVFISSCNTQKSVTTFVKQHCSEVHTIDQSTGNVQIAFECDSLYDSKGVKDVCGKSLLCFDVSRGKITGELVCGNENTSLKDIFLTLFSKIKFKK